MKRIKQRIRIKKKKEEEYKKKEDREMKAVSGQLIKIERQKEEKERSETLSEECNKNIHTNKSLTQFYKAKNYMFLVQISHCGLY